MKTVCPETYEDWRASGCEGGVKVDRSYRYGALMLATWRWKRMETFANTPNKFTQARARELMLLAIRNAKGEGR